jgi:hypothetical protein
MAKARLYMGQVVLKHFQGFGLFRGEVVDVHAFDSGIGYRVGYSDGDQEDMVRQGRVRPSPSCLSNRPAPLKPLHWIVPRPTAHPARAAAGKRALTPCPARPARLAHRCLAGRGRADEMGQQLNGIMEITLYIYLKLISACSCRSSCCPGLLGRRHIGVQYIEASTLPSALGPACHRHLPIAHRDHY